MNTRLTPLPPAPPLWEDTLAPGAHWSGVLRRGTSLRITALEAGANVAAMLYNYESLLERYNMADTLKAQHMAFLTAGCVCYSDMGRILCSITADSCGWHDTICGLSDAAMVTSRYGSTRFQEQRNDYYKNGRDSMLNELGKYGLGKRDLIANINFFSRGSPSVTTAALRSIAHTARPTTMSTCVLRCTRCWYSRPASIRSTPIQATVRAPRAARLGVRAGTPAGSLP